MTTTVPAHPRWLVRCAWAAFLVTVPSALWRVLMIVGLVPGTAAMRAFELGGAPLVGYAYVVGLSVVQLSTAFLVVGLVRPWGERFRGRWVPALPVVALGALGGGAVTAIFDVAMVTALVQGHRPDGGYVHDGALAVMVACYLPIFLWGPLTLAATAGYARRRLGRRSRTASPALAA